MGKELVIEPWVIVAAWLGISALFGLILWLLHWNGTRQERRDQPVAVPAPVNHFAPPVPAFPDVDPDRLSVADCLLIAYQLLRTRQLPDYFTSTHDPDQVDPPQYHAVPVEVLPENVPRTTEGTHDITPAIVVAERREAFMRDAAALGWSGNKVFTYIGGKRADTLAAYKAIKDEIATTERTPDTFADLPPRTDYEITFEEQPA